MDKIKIKLKTEANAVESWFVVAAKFFKMS